VFGASRFTRRQLLRTSVLGAAGLAAAALVGCSDDDDDDDDDDDNDATASPTSSATAAATTAATASPTATEAAAPDVADLGAAQEFALVDGWARGEAVQYYDFGMNSPLDAASSCRRRGPNLGLHHRHGRRRQPALRRGPAQHHRRRPR
jgi:hypothetical protein